MQHENDHPGDASHGAQQDPLASTDFRAGFAMPLPITHRRREDEEGNDHEPVITLERFRQKESARLLAAKSIEDGGNDGTDQHDQPSYPYAERQQFETRTAHRPPSDSRHVGTGAPNTRRPPTNVVTTNPFTFHPAKGVLR